MPLIKFTLDSSIKAKLSADPKLKAGLYKVTYDAMNNFQTAQKLAFENSALIPSFSVSKKLASVAFAKSMEKIQPIIAEAVAKAVADSVHSYVKGAQVIITPPLTSTPAAIGAPVLIPAIPPGKLI